MEILIDFYLVGNSESQANLLVDDCIAQKKFIFKEPSAELLKSLSERVLMLRGNTNVITCGEMVSHNVSVKPKTYTIVGSIQECSLEYMRLLVLDGWEVSVDVFQQYA